MLLVQLVLALSAWPFLSTWKPSAKTKAAGAPVDVDISKLEAGQLVRVLWRKNLFGFLKEMNLL